MPAGPSRRRKNFPTRESNIHSVSLDSNILFHRVALAPDGAPTFKEWLNDEWSPIQKKWTKYAAELKGMSKGMPIESHAH